MSTLDPSLTVPPTSVTIADGTSVSIDEYVYLQAEYPGEPHYVGRVMEFVYVPRVRQPKPLLSMSGIRKQMADKTASGDDSGRDTPTPASSTAQLRVRLAWFQRPRDLPLTRVRAKDMRLLVATMHTDLNPVSAIRGKCQVRHVSEISDLNAWKSQVDHYYYTQLFDRYSTRLYDIVPVSQIRNAPQEVLQKLHDTYEFIFAETQKINDLVSTRRACTVCAKWCSISESVKCSLCEKHYHLQCLDPPPSRKPAKGYGWQCAACLRRMQDHRARSEDTANDSASSAASFSADRKRITRNMAEELTAHRILVSNTPNGVSSDTESRLGKRLKLSHGDSRMYADGAGSPIPRPKNRGVWPFRYFGINTDIDDVLHDDERIYPRAVSRIGPKYQAIVPDMVSPSGPELDKQLIRAREHITHGVGREKDKPARGRPRTKGIHVAGPVNGYANGVGGGGGGGTTRWHGKNAEQMDRTWDEIEQRRGNHDEQLFFRQPKTLPDDELDMYMEAIVPFLQRHFASIQDFTLLDCQDTALNGLSMHKYDVEETLILIPDCPEEYIRHRAPGDFWTPESLAQFNENMCEYGSNLQSIHDQMPNTTRRAITLHYYLTKPTELGQKLLETYDARSHAGPRRPHFGQGESAVNVHVEVPSDVGSMANTPGSSPARISGMARGQFDAHRCANCLSDHSTKWTPAPVDFVSYNTRSGKTPARRVICDQCSEYWQHYAIMPDQDIINTRKPQLSAHGTSTRNSHMRDETRAVNPRGRPPLSATLPKMRVPEAWPLIACDVCKQKTNNSMEIAPLVCRDCGLCVHYGCSGYPPGAVPTPKRWKCGMCTNSTNPTVSINYSCVLCCKEPAGRQMMWRTKGNNWVHPVCALAARETSLVYSHGNIVVTGTKNIGDAWTHACSVCTRTEGVVQKCCADACNLGAHATCARPFASVNDPTGDTAPMLVVRSSGKNSLSALLEGNTADSVMVALTCKMHSANTLDVYLGALDTLGRPIMESAISAKNVKPSTLSRSAMLRSSVDQLQSTRPTPTAEDRVQESDVKPKLPSPEPSMSPMPSTSVTNPKMVAWATTNDDPVCSKCSTSFSPIWWPLARTPTDATSNIRALCHRCYSTESSPRNITPL
ncbi:putative PHD type zinc finger protein with BAH domain-containing protein [Coemansia sp. RSA 475]|nr:putative PHD type zinc finger protein with BAH domain-containing protein [Coemansia sp. RSA 475]